MEGVLGFQDVRTFRESVKGTVRAFAYSTPITVLPASSSAQATISIESLSAFYARTITGDVFDATGLEVSFATVAQPSIAIQDTTSGAFFEDKDTRWQNLVGTALFPHVLRPPILLKPRTTLAVVFTNNAAVGLLCQVSLVGFKSYEA
jgi:hypothetical protein